VCGRARGVADHAVLDRTGRLLGPAIDVAPRRGARREPRHSGTRSADSATGSRLDCERGLSVRPSAQRWSARGFVEPNDLAADPSGMRTAGAKTCNDANYAFASRTRAIAALSSPPKTKIQAL
jgi:hypothetical protein